jgi:hypothetical protein
MTTVDASSAYFAWRYYHPREAEDPSAVWAAAWRAGGRAALQSSSRIVELVPMLRELLHLLQDGQVEADVRASDRRSSPQFEQLFDEPEYQYEVQW